MKTKTMLSQLGRNPVANYGMINPPIYRGSTVVFPTLEDYDRAERGDYHQSTYGIYGGPTHHALAGLICELEGGAHTFLSSSGLMAIAMALLAFVKQGDHILLPDTVYGPVRRFAALELARLGVTATYYDPLIGAEIAGLMEDNTRVVMVESPGSLTFEVQDIPSIAEAAHRKGCVVIGDNTWATPLHVDAFALGMDVSIQAGTKYIGGHADLLFGALTCREPHRAALERVHRSYGPCMGPDDAALALRGMRTLAVRLKTHEAHALTVAKWLQSREEVSRILHPAFADCPGHDFWRRDFSGSCGLFTFLLKESVSKQALAAMLDNMDYFCMGYSWGGFESLIIPLYLDGVRTATGRFSGETGLRVHIGLEDPDDLIRDLEAGFARMKGVL